MRSRHTLKALIVVTTVVAALAVASPAAAGPIPVTGGVFTSVNEAVDGGGKCLNGSGQINCNLYSGKPYVWLNGGPTANGLGPNGQYFFVVLEPGGQPDPNDGGPKNLSDDFDLYTNRTFTVTSGEVSAYTGTHDFDNGVAGDPTLSSTPPFIRLYPYADTSNPGGVYIMAVCSLANGYPVNPSDCKYDAFKAPFPDTTPPVCVLTGISGDGLTIQVTVQDPFGPSDSGSGIESIVVDAVQNATVSIPDFAVGTLSPVVITATKIDSSLSSFLQLTVTNVAGLSTTCDPIVPGVKPKSGVRTRAAGRHAQVM